MSGRPVTTETDLRQRAVAAREQFIASGVNISEWARQRSLDVKLTHQILRGERSCMRGESHRIAVALGIKDEVPPPGAPLTSATPSRANLDDLKAAS